MFERVLIANRGEIACRVIRTARRLGITSIAVFSEADAAARHVALADEARLIGPPAPAESYLAIDRVIAAARASGAEAVHPGYGFLSENANFAEACAAAGLVFVGPPIAAIRAMGSKSEAKALMAAVGVPLVPGYHGADQDDAVLAAAAGELGYPVLIKASAGGGGKGMRVVEQAAGFAEALAGARREAAAAFGDQRMLIEKYLAAPRHIEVQVFADAAGNAVHLFERDCSLQRRHQKVVEEAPAPGLDEARRAAMGAAAVAATRAIGYQGAGTVEFIAEAGSFYFMEMNTRLQVEHPVTEMITGLDLVEWQLRIAAGELLPLAQEQIRRDGHAVEARLYAEDPGRDFLPSTGRLVHLALPQEDAHVRVETGVVEGDEVTLHYDPMIAKLVVWDCDRGAALRRLRRALAATRVAGPATNLALLRAIAGHPGFATGGVDTGFIARHRGELIPPPAPAADEVLALAALGELLLRRAAAERQAAGSADPHSPWNLRTGWRLNVETQSKLELEENGRTVTITVGFRDGGYRFELPGGEIAARGSLGDGGRLRAQLDERVIEATLVRDGGDLVVLTGQASHRLRLADSHDPDQDEEGGAERVTAPMPGRVARVLVGPGQHVERGAPLMILEAMKMEHTVSAPGAASVREVRFAEGDLVDEGDELVVFESGA